MASKKNTFTQHVKRLHSDLAMVNFMACSFEGATQSLLKERSDKKLTSASFCDLLGKYTTKNGRVFASYGGYIAHGDNWVALIDEAIRLAQLDAVANAFEVIERFIKDVASELFYAERGRMTVPQRSRQRVLQERKIRENTPPYFRRVVEELARRNCDELFRLMFKHVPGLRDRLANAGAYDLHEIHRIVERFRHSKAHKNGRYDDADFVGLSPQSQKIVNHCVRPSAVFGDQRILPGHRDVATLLTWECEYAQILYETISVKLGMKLDYQPMTESPSKQKRQR